MDVPRVAGGPLTRPRSRCKRAVDVVGALLLLVLGVVPILLACAAIRLDSGGPALFSQTRVGHDGRLFRLYKLRTMQHDNDATAQRRFMQAVIERGSVGDAAPSKRAEDPRITAVGRVLRRYSIDELPQAWNVLRGEMSLVGPRPPLPFEVALYDERALQRLSVVPGMTGLWQVSGRSSLSFSRMLDLDLAYAEASTVRMDVGIVLRTPWALLSGRGAV